MAWGALVSCATALAASERSFKKTVFEADQKESLKVGGEVKTQYTLRLVPTQSEGPRCEAEVEISYVQMHDRVRVETTVVNDDCAASSGRYRVRLRIRDEHGETQTQEFEESWARDDDALVMTTKHYPVAEGQELVWARVRTSPKTNCACTVPGSEAQATKAQDDQAVP